MKFIFLFTSILCVVYSAAPCQPLAVEASYTTNNQPKALDNPAGEPTRILLGDVGNYVGKTVTVCGRVYDARLLTNIVSKPTLMNLGSDNAKEPVEIRIKFSDLAKFDYDPAKIFLHKDVCITGQVSNAHGFNEISVDSQHARLLLYEAMNTVDTSRAPERRLALVSKAYLFAGPGLDEPIITHLKLGTVMAPVYSGQGWTYGRIIELGGTGDQPRWMYGFVRNQALGIGKAAREWTVKQPTQVQTQQRKPVGDQSR